METRSPPRVIGKAMDVRIGVISWGLCAFSIVQSADQSTSLSLELCWASSSSSHGRHCPLCVEVDTMCAKEQKIEVFSISAHSRHFCSAPFSNSKLPMLPPHQLLVLLTIVHTSHFKREYATPANEEWQDVKSKPIPSPRALRKSILASPDLNFWTGETFFCKVKSMLKVFYNVYFVSKKYKIKVRLDLRG